MTTLLWHLLKAVWRTRVNAFLEVYALMTALTAIGVAWAVRSGTKPENRSAQDLTTSGGGNRLNGWVVAPLSLAVLILAGYAVVVMKWEAFADYDDSFYTRYTLRGINFPIWILPNIGRFFPLGDQEFNLLRHFTSSIFGYHAVSIAELAVVFCAVLFLDRALSITARASLGVAFLIAPSTDYAFGGLVFQERNVVFWLACMLFCVTLFARSGFTAWAVAAAVSAQNMMYYKETAFLLLFGFAAGRLVLRCWRPDGEGWDASPLQTRESRLDLCFVFLALIFILYYASVMMHYPNVQYIDQNRVPWGNVIPYYMKVDLLALVLIIVALSRAYLIARRKIAPVLLWDGLALGGAACYFAYIVMRLCRPYYLVPLDFIAVLYVGRFFLLSWKSASLWTKVAMSALALVVLVQNVSLSSFITYERENLIHAKVELADAILVRSRNDPRQIQRLFFPFTTTYPMQEFASYLSYRGLNVERYETMRNPPTLHSVVIVSRRIAKDGPCPDYSEFVCLAGDKPNTNDLVVELPDDLESLSDIDLYKDDGTVLFTYEPHPRLPQWISPELDYFRVVSRRWRFMPLPDRWLQASITLSK